MPKLFTAVSILLLLLNIDLRAQTFGGNPSSQKWKQINTDTARIIYPVSLDSQANRIASIIHYLAAQKPVSLGNQLKKVNIVLQHQTTIPNGYVQLGPYRSEFFLTPAINNFDQGSISWADQLALHEYRHVQQFNNFNNGLSKLMKVLFGEEGYALAINASVPDWFYEGDAVYNETVLSSQGRGRLPLFINAYPALWQADKKYSWMKLRNGSLKDYVPNHYYLGYLLVKYGREKYGNDFWAKVTKDASAYKGLFYPFQKAVKKYSGNNYKLFREQAFEEYKRQLQGYSATVENKKTGDEDFKSSKTETVFPANKKFITNYFFPYRVSSDSLLYLKTTYRHRPAFYIKDKQGEHRLRIRDISIDDQFSYRNGKIVYAAYENDARRGWKDYSVIRMLDVATGQQQTITQKTKYFTPDISADGSKIAAVQIAENGKSELHILETATGAVINTIRSAEIQLFTDPKFADDNTIVTAVRLQDGKMTLAMAEIATGNTVRLTNPSFNVIGYPCVSNGIVYFTASYEGNDDVFALRLNDKKIFRISGGPSGNYFINAADGKLTWSSFTAEGFQLMQTNENSGAWEEMDMTSAERIAEKFPVVLSDSVSDILNDATTDRNFATGSYKKSTKLFNFHSWRPYYSDPVFTYSLYGQNVLNTMETEIYYLYNENENTSAVGANAVYGGFFPFLNAGTEFTFNRQTTIGSRLRQWNQLDSRVGLSIPLNKTKGQTFRSFNAGSFYVLRNEFNKEFYKDSLGATSFGYLLHTLSWSQQVQRAVQHIYPRLAYSLSASHRHAISRFTGYQFIGSGAMYVPGFLSTHNIVLTGSFQQRDTLGQVVFADRFAYSRGYEGRYFSRMWRLSANYHLPLLLPDWGFGNILYLQRLRANLFYDFTKVFSKDKRTTADQRSAGIEFFADTKWWNQYPLTFGIRISRLLDRDQFNGFKGARFEFVLPVSIIPK